MKIRLDAHNNLIEISKHIPHKEATGEFIGIAKFSKEFRYYCEKIAKTFSIRRITILYGGCHK